MLLETCRYQFVDGKVVTKMFGMKGHDWDIEPGWYHDKKEAKAAALEPNDPELETGSVPNSNDQLVKISHFARKLADDLGINVNEVTGTGTEGAITKDDITNHYNLEA